MILCRDLSARVPLPLPLPRASGFAFVCALGLSLSVASLPSLTRAGAEENEPPSAAVGASPAAARARFSDGNRRYALGDYLGAEEAFESASVLDPRLPGPYRNLGLVLLATHRCDAAVEAFRAYLRLRPTGIHTARIEREIARCEAAPTKRGSPRETSLATVHVTSNGAALAGALVRIDGVAPSRVTSSAPLTIELTPGRHAIRVEKSGFAPGEASVVAIAGGHEELTIPMRAPVERPSAAARHVESASRPCAQVSDCRRGEACAEGRCVIRSDGGASADGGIRAGSATN